MYMYTDVYIHLQVYMYMHMYKHVFYLHMYIYICVNMLQCMASHASGGAAANDTEGFVVLHEQPGTFLVSVELPTYLLGNGSHIGPCFFERALKYRSLPVL